tara:strand:- start:131 stop:823 length:693 start_codon:yes stop_codon:yes gene_type:complete
MNFFLRNKLKVFLSLIFLTYSFLAINVRKNITKDDIKVIKMLKVDNYCKEITDYQSELNCIKNIQIAQKKLVDSEDCRIKTINPEPLEMINENTGCCFDRARLIEKSLDFYGIKSRRVFLIQKNKYGIFTIFIPKVGSHAVTEAKTSKGWIGIETVNDLFILTDNNNMPLTFKEAIKKEYNFPKSEDLDNLYNKDLLALIGVYSRHGKFYKPYLPFPEINFVNFFSNLIH